MAGCGAPAGSGGGEGAFERGIDNFDTTYRCHCLEACLADR